MRHRELTVDEAMGMIRNRGRGCEDLLFASHDIALEAAVELVRGQHYLSRNASWIYTANYLDWSGFRPVIDGQGRFTGEIVDSDCGYFITTDDLAAISPEDAQAAGWTVDDEGYARPPESAS
jgi:hypothetical protein